MALYGQAVSSGVSGLQLAFTGENAETKAAYDAAYAKAAQRHNIQEARHTAQLNIASIRQDQITSNISIQLQQDQAEAQAIVAAAAAGVEGGSVDDVIYETKKNEALAINNVKRRTEIAEESQLAAIGSQTSALLSVQDEEFSYFGAILNGLSSSDTGDLKKFEAFSNSGGG